MDKLNKLTIALNYLEGYLLGYSDDIAEHVRGCITIAESLRPRIKSEVDELYIEYAKLTLTKDGQDIYPGYTDEAIQRRANICTRLMVLKDQIRSLEGGEG